MNRRKFMKFLGIGAVVPVVGVVAGNAVASEPVVDTKWISDDLQKKLNLINSKIGTINAPFLYDSERGHVLISTNPSAVIYDKTKPESALA